VTITGSAGTVLRGFTIIDASGIRFMNLAFNGNGRDTIIGGKGNYGSNITIRRCSFTNADEFVHVHGGDTWMIEQNRFGQNNAGLTAVKFEPGSKTPQFRNVTVQNNLFHATGLGRIGVGVKAGQRLPGLPYNVRIVNNTIITTKSGVALSDGWDAWPRALQPVVADNVMKVFAPPWNTRGRLFSNVAEHGTAVSGVQIGPLNLNPDLSPSSASKLVIDRADRRFAPRRDYFNHGRLRSPDRGAIEYLR
jgi:hypothetical protein